MFKNLYFIIFISAISATSVAFAAGDATYNFITPASYEQMYPYMNNAMRVATNPGTTPQTLESAPNVLYPENTNARRAVVARPQNVVRNAGQPNTTARSAVATSGPQTQARGVVARGGNNIAGRGARADESINGQIRASANAFSENSNRTATVTSDRCLSDYTQCMDGYCKRKDTTYNRCYCSARLAQIDSQYQPEIDSLIKQILTLKDGGTWTDAEMNAYWDEKVGVYTGDNSWKNLDASLNINWADTESRVRGSNAFITGHDYCVQNLNGCYYMASNLRDIYRSEIARDCASYESGLQKIKNAATSIVESFSD